MTTLKLIVQGELTHEIPLDFSNIKIIEQREHYVHNRVEWLKYSYRKSLLLYSNWEIIMEAESKMNNCNYQFTDLKNNLCQNKLQVMNQQTS